MAIAAAPPPLTIRILDGPPQLGGQPMESVRLIFRGAREQEIGIEDRFTNSAGEVKVNLIRSAKSFFVIPTQAGKIDAAKTWYPYSSTEPLWIIVAPLRITQNEPRNFGPPTLSYVPGIVTWSQAAPPRTTMLWEPGAHSPRAIPYTSATTVIVCPQPPPSDCFCPAPPARYWTPSR